MKAESSQAVGRVNIPPDEFRKKSQTKISDHAVELFIPSREDSTRFKPSKKVSKVHVYITLCLGLLFSIAVFSQF